MKILIIGSQGFIGSNAVIYFKEKGYDVWGCGVSDADMSNYFKVSRIAPEYKAIFDRHKFDVCINASGSSGVGFSFDNPDIDFQMNVANVYNLLNSIRLFNPACKFINLSSAAVYGDPIELPIKEDARLKPVSPYGYHKEITEKLAEEFHHLFGLQLITARIFSAYGPGIKKQLFWDIYQKSKSCGNIKLFGSGNETRDFIFIDDLLYALELILKKGDFNGNIYNLANGKEISIQEVASTFVNLINDNISLTFSGEHKDGDPDCWRADISKISSLGYESKHNLREGLKKYIEWLKYSESE